VKSAIEPVKLYVPLHDANLALPPTGQGHVTVALTSAIGPEPCGLKGGLNILQTFALPHMTFVALDVTPNPKSKKKVIAPGVVLKFPPTTVIGVPPVPGPLVVSSDP